MARMKDYAIDLRNLEEQFIGIVRQIFLAEDYKVLATAGRGRDNGADLLVSPPTGDKLIAVELKLYRSDRIQTGLFNNAIAQLGRGIGSGLASSGILIVTVPIARAQRQQFETESLQIWDLEMLTEKARPYPEIAEALTELIRAAQVGALGQRLMSPTVAMLVDEAPQLQRVGEGAALAARLEESVAGRRPKASRAFEDLCQQALEMLFGEDFAGWKRQASIERGYQRLDLVARLVPVNAFWSTLAADFHTRYIIFEFKNYTASITQDEVHSTEKYLFTNALRSVALIVARKGDSPSAQRAMRGALREQGKLILCISMAELCSLLRGRDNGEDPTNLLIERMDEMLIAIAR